MTTDLEKQFFDTFGIEPKFVESCTKPRHKCSERFIKDCSKCPRAWRKYPQITDRILLELICISKQITMLSDFFMYRPSIEELKNNILENMLNKDLFNFKNKDIKHQVRTLFEEG